MLFMYLKVFVYTVDDAANNQLEMPPTESSGAITVNDALQEQTCTQQDGQAVEKDHTHNKMEADSDEEYVDADEDVIERGDGPPDRPPTVQDDTVTSDQDEGTDRHLDSTNGEDHHTTTSYVPVGDATSSGDCTHTHEPTILVATSDEQVHEQVVDDDRETRSDTAEGNSTTTPPHLPDADNSTRDENEDAEYGHETEEPEHEPGTNNLGSLGSLNTNETSNEESIPRDSVSISTSLQVSINSTQSFEDLTTPTSLSPPNQYLVDATSFESPGLLYARTDQGNVTSTPNRRGHSPPPESGGDVLLLENVAEESVDGDGDRGGQEGEGMDGGNDDGSQVHVLLLHCMCV